MNRAAISACVILGTLMQALDTTIPNVALPYMQGSVSASQDEIDWVLTSYIVAAAIMTAPSGFLAGRFGIKRIYLVSIAGFTVASMLCGMAQSLAQIVLFRVLQGAFGAALAPLSQAVLFNITPRERQASAMGMFGVAVMVGPVLGRWLTANFNWRYVFYVNLPIGLIAFIGTKIFLRESERNAKAKLDWFGFGTLSLAVGALQILLDRGEELDWFSSREIIVETIVAGTSFYLFLVHTFTSKAPFVRPDFFRNRNFTAGTLFIFVTGLTYYAAMALQPPFLQGLMNYPVITSGIVMGPRGIGTMAAMLTIGRISNRVDTRILLGIGLIIVAGTFYLMTGWTADVSQFTIALTGMVQGTGLGLIFVPLSTATMSTLTPRERPEGAGIYNLSRNIGSAIGISMVNSLLTQHTQVIHAELAQQATPFNRALMTPAVERFWNPLTTVGRAALNGVITEQAQIIAYVDNYKLLMIMTIASAPLLMIFKKTPKIGEADRT